MIVKSTCFRAIFKRCVARTYATSVVQTTPKRGDKVMVAMSGGVDSSVTARLLAEEDYDLSAVYMRNWDTRDESGTDEGCEWKKDWEDVQRVCRILDIPCKMVDLSRQYWNTVFAPSLRVWESGLTPNPDVWCNREIKFGALLNNLPLSPEQAKAAWIATGHYAMKDWNLDPNGHLRPRLLRGVDPIKDQSYYLSSITEDALQRTIFPIGHLPKNEVKELARKYDLPTADRPESMGLCFVGEKTKFTDFLSSYLSPNPGPIIDIETNKEISTHNGLWSFTIGENARVSGMKEKYFIADKDPSRNALLAVPGRNHPSLFMNDLSITNWTWIRENCPPDLASGKRLLVRIRHRMRPIPCTVYEAGPGVLRILMDDPQHGVAPGQVAALWDDQWCLGCGLIGNVVRTMDVTEDQSLNPVA